MNYKETAQKVLENVGGPDNVKNVYHCATRLRFTLNASGPVRMDALKNTPGVISVLGSGTQIQVVIGATVNKVFNELQPLLPAMESNAAKEDAPAEKGNLLNKVFNVIAGIFAPYLPLLMCSGILTGLLTLAGTMGWMDTASGTYAIFSAASNSLFYFFPILLSFTAAKQFGTNPYVAVVIGATLIHPTFAALADLEGAAAFLGIPVVMQSYASSVIPAIAGVGLYAVIDRTLSKVIPDSLRSLVVTLAGMVIVIPVTILVFPEHAARRRAECAGWFQPADCRYPCGRPVRLYGNVRTAMGHYPNHHYEYRESGLRLLYAYVADGLLRPDGRGAGCIPTCKNGGAETAFTFQLPFRHLYRCDRADPVRYPDQVYPAEPVCRNWRRGRRCGLRADAR